MSGPSSCSSTCCFRSAGCAISLPALSRLVRHVPLSLCAPEIEARAHRRWTALRPLFTPLLACAAAQVPIFLVVTCLCHNKSMNQAPFNGDPVKSYPKPAQTAMAVAVPQQVVQMQCPEGASELTPRRPQIRICPHLSLQACKGSSSLWNTRK
jgi:hypothetical protein